MTNPPYRIVLPGVPVSSRRGALGWCNVVLLRRDGRTILFDTGSFGDRHPLLSRLGELGVDPAGVDLVFASHFHYDHVANAEIFGCPVVLSEGEWRHVQEAGYVAAGDPFVPRALVPFRELARTVVPGHDRAFEIAPDGGVRYLGGERVALELYADPRSDRRVMNLLEDACGT